MISHMGKKIICVKDLPSNMIEEAIFILKSDILESTNSKLESKVKDIILNEAEDIVMEYEKRIQIENNIENEKYKNKLKNIKREAIYLAGLFAVACIAISIII